jgi:hypothetical protein
MLKTLVFVSAVSAEGIKQKISPKAYVFATCGTFGATLDNSWFCAAAQAVPTL